MKITNRYIESVASSTVIESVIKKEFSAVVSYWIARVFDELQTLSKTYLTEKQKIIEKYAKRYEEDTDKFKKGEMITNDASVQITDMLAFTEELDILLNIELDININKIKLDLKNEPKCTIEEMALLLPVIEYTEGE